MGPRRATRTPRSALTWALFGLAACGGGERTVIEDPPDAGPVDAEVLSFTASSTEVDEGQTVFLAWDVEGATQVRIEADPGEPVVDSSRRLAGVQESAPLVAETTFRLTAEGPTGTDEATVTVGVRPPDGDAPPRIITFRASPAEYQGFEVPVRLFWSAAGQVELTANGEVPEGFDGASVGALNLTVRQARVVYELTATRAGQTVTATTTVERLEEEVEPNDTPETASIPSGGIGQGRITEGDRDLYRIEVPDQGRVRAEVREAAGSCTFDSRLILYRYRPNQNPVLEFVTQNDDISPNDRCSLIDPTEDLRAAELPAGPYILELRGAGPMDVGRYQLDIEVSGPECGNGTPELASNETCDDGNTRDGDGCSADCQVETLQDLNAPARQTISVPMLSSGERAVVSLTAPDAAGVAASLPGSSDCAAGQIRLVDADQLEGSGFRRLAQNRQGSCQVLPRPVASGTYFVEFEAPDGGFGGGDLEVSIAPIGCGDRLLQAGGEACDDGNTQDGDGCSSTCTLEATGPLSANASDLPLRLPAADAGRTVLQLSLSSTTSIRLTPSQGTCPDGGIIVLQNAAFEDVGRVVSESACPELDPESDRSSADLPPGDYFVSLFGRGPMAVNPTYDVEFVSPACPNNIVEPSNGEECDSDQDVFCDVGCVFLVQDTLTLDCPGACPAVNGELESGDVVDRYRLQPVDAAGVVGAQLFVDPVLNAQLSMRLVDVQGRQLARADGDPMNAAFLDQVPFLGRLDPVTGEAPPLFLEVFRPNMLGFAEYSAEILQFTGLCGNGRLAFGEQCDDGNRTSGDGCSDRCLFETPTRVESEDNQVLFNNSLRQAEPLATEPNITRAPLNGSLLPVGDVDFFSFTVDSGGAASLRAFVTSRPSGEQVCEPFSRARITLLTSGGTELAQTEAECGELNGVDGEDLYARDLPPGDYALRLDRPAEGQSLSYLLFVQLAR
jgi:cysteine-rich repeat protein